MKLKIGWSTGRNMLTLVFFTLICLIILNLVCHTSKSQGRPKGELCTIMGNWKSTTDSLVGDAILIWHKKKINVFFLNDHQGMSKEVIRLAKLWEPHSGLTFVETFNRQEADIRISFNAQGWWSYIGRNASSVKDLNEPTLSLSKLYNYNDAKRKNVILHEFGHAIGLIHELQNHKIQKWITGEHCKNF